MLRLALSALSRDFAGGHSFPDALRRLLEHVLQIYQADGACLSLGTLSPSGPIDLFLGCCHAEDASFGHRWDPSTRSCLTIPIKHRNVEIGQLRLGKIDQDRYFKKHHAAELDTFVGYFGFLLDTVKAKDRALAGMANGVLHDFNNALQTLMSGLSLIKTVARQDDLTPTIEMMALTMQHAQEVIQEMRCFLGEPGESAEDATLNDLLREVVPVAEAKVHSTPGKNIEFRCQLDADAACRVSRFPLKRVLLNLVFNAIDATPDGGTIRLHSQSDENTCSFSIHDTGVGITPEDRTRIFDPFFSTKGPGHSGLGLSASHGIIKQYGGEIDVTSAPGQGTTMTVSLPQQVPSGV
jgi:signal transduction histidine kinase